MFLSNNVEKILRGDPSGASPPPKEQTINDFKKYLTKTVQYEY